MSERSIYFGICLSLTISNILNLALVIICYDYSIFAICDRKKKILLASMNVNLPKLMKLVGIPSTV